MRSIKTVIVDDEILGRGRVKKLLANFDRIQLVGEGSSGSEAIQLIKDYKPDLVLLDIEMPDKTGLQVVHAIPECERPFFIFITAHDRFALNAFDLNATDYVLKPYDTERFEKAINHAIDQIEIHERSALSGQLIQIMDSYRSKAQDNPFIIKVKVRGQERQINLYDVLYIEADGNYLKLQLDKERFMIRQTMQQVLQELDQSCFLRIHRSIIVNINYLKLKSYRGNNEYVFKLRNGVEVTSGRSFKPEIDQFFQSVQS
ncbi:MAG: LytTR family DNA-binding domain-containing protein [Salibacteraceae bacterium]